MDKCAVPARPGPTRFTCAKQIKKGIAKPNGPARRPTCHAARSGGTGATRRRAYPSHRRTYLPYPHHSPLSSHLTHANPLSLSPLPPPTASPPASTSRKPRSSARRPPHRSPASAEHGAACCVLRDRAARTGRASWSTYRSLSIQSAAALLSGDVADGSEATRPDLQRHGSGGALAGARSGPRSGPVPVGSAAPLLSGDVAGGSEARRPDLQRHTSGTSPRHSDPPPPPLLRIFASLTSFLFSFCAVAPWHGEENDCFPTPPPSARRDEARRAPTDVPRGHSRLKPMDNFACKIYPIPQERGAMPVARPEPQEPRVIAHLDLDCFYVQVEQRRNPSLRG